MREEAGVSDMMSWVNDSPTDPDSSNQKPAEQAQDNGEPSTDEAGALRSSNASAPLLRGRIKRLERLLQHQNDAVLPPFTAPALFFKSRIQILEQMLQQKEAELEEAYETFGEHVIRKAAKEVLDYYRQPTQTFKEVFGPRFAFPMFAHFPRDKAKLAGIWHAEDVGSVEELDELIKKAQLALTKSPQLCEKLKLEADILAQHSIICDSFL